MIGQLNMLAQRDMEGWVDLLVLVVVAVFWVIGGLVKAARRKPPQAPARPQGPPRETWQQRLVRKAEELQRAMEMKQPKPAGQRPAPSRPTPQAGEVKIRPGRGGESVLVYQRDQSQGGAARAREVARQQRAKEAVAAAQYAAAKEPAGELKVEIGELGPASPAEGMMGVTLPQAALEPGRKSPGTAGYEPASIIDYDDPDALRKAILHYEILGRPLGLRDPSETATF